MTAIRRAQHAHDITTLYVTAERLPAWRLPARPVGTVGPVQGRPTPRPPDRDIGPIVAASGGALALLGALAIVSGVGMAAGAAAADWAMVALVLAPFALLARAVLSRRRERHCPGCNG